MAGIGSGAERDACGEVLAEALFKETQSTQVLRSDRGARLHLHADDTPVGGLQDEIDLDAVTVAEVVKARAGLRPLHLGPQLPRDERFDKTAGQLGIGPKSPAEQPRRQTVSVIISFGRRTTRAVRLVDQAGRQGRSGSRRRFEMGQVATP